MAHVKNVIRKIFHIRESGIIIPTVLFILIVSIINPVFISRANLFNVLRSTGFTLITAIGMTFVLIAGGLDLSVGSVLALGGCAAGIAMVNFELPVFVSILCGCACGFLVGLLNGYIIVKFRIPAMIMTLGTMYMARGIVYIVTEGVPIYPLPAEFQVIEQENLFGIPKVVLLCVILSVAGHIFLKKTVLGRSIYAAGGNPEAARLSGINLNKIQITCYCIAGVLASLTGIMMSSRLGSAQPNGGNGYEMTVIAAVIIGGTSTAGGSGTILGTVVGALFMNVLSNAMTILKVSVYWQNFVVGFILVFAVILEQYKQKKMMKIGLKA